MYDVCPSDCPCWGSFSMCAPDCAEEMSEKQSIHEQFQEFLEVAMDDTEAEIRCYEMVAKFREIDDVVGEFLDLLAQKFGGFTWYDALGNVRYSATYEDMLRDHCTFCTVPKPGYHDQCETCMIANC